MTLNYHHRIYDTILQEHFVTRRQMAFVSGPRQVGKTTLCQQQAECSLNWDNMDDRAILLKGPGAIANHFKLHELREKPVRILFDELHKFPRWKTLLKGFFDTYGEHVHILVTGSSRMDLYRRGGDSMMGRYFIYRIHPFSVAEITQVSLPDSTAIIRPPSPADGADYAALWHHGGYPEPFVLREERFSRQWQSLRLKQLLSEDIRDLSNIQHLDQLELLAHLLVNRSARQLVYSNLAGEIRVTADTVRRWVGMLCQLHLGFLVRPWFKNVSRSLRKEPKWFLRDWSAIADPGSRAETFVACHLLKAVEGWTDLGLGNFELGYLRDKSQREVDFVVLRDGVPWFLVEVKQSRENELSPALKYYQQQLQAPYAFQVVMDADFIQADCFSRPGHPVIVPARTLLSQLL